MLCGAGIEGYIVSITRLAVIKYIMKERKIIYEGNYIALFDDGGIGVSDGFGYIGEEDAKKLYEALKKYFKNKK